MIRRVVACALVALMAGCGGGDPAMAPTGTATAAAVRFLISDPYPLTAAQPDHFDVACDGHSTVASPPAVNPDGTSFLHYSLSGLMPGAHSCNVAAADASNQQSTAASVSFTL
jgi:hypothetical protein